MQACRDEMARTSSIGDEENSGADLLLENGTIDDEDDDAPRGGVGVNDDVDSGGDEDAQYNVNAKIENANRDNETVVTMAADGGRGIDESQDNSGYESALDLPSASARSIISIGSSSSKTSLQSSFMSIGYY